MIGSGSTSATLSDAAREPAAEPEEPAARVA